MTMRTNVVNRLFVSALLILSMILSIGAVELKAANRGDWTTDDVKVFVEKAAAYARSHSKAEALKAFSAKEGAFQQGGLYIFAYDFSGNVIAHGGDQALIGRNLLGMKDPKGVEVIKELVRLAKDGSGWLYYTWPNPEHAGKQEPKLGYVVKIDDSWFIGSGTYGPAAIKH
jgi:signal transduction histidine kinase